MLRVNIPFTSVSSKTITGTMKNVSSVHAKPKMVPNIRAALESEFSNPLMMTPIVAAMSAQTNSCVLTSQAALTPALRLG